jgi:BMFP domain-containing protein YqiC
MTPAEKAFREAHVAYLYALDKVDRELAEWQRLIDALKSRPLKSRPETRVEK